MQKQAPSVARILVAAGFALSCFALLMFLWVAFGGPIPLKPKSYRITAYFPEATQLAVESDVRIGGLSVGKVKSVELAPGDERIEGKDVAAAEIEIEPEFAPISADAHAILRQKTLLGETYVELTSGTEPGGDVTTVALGEAVEGAPPGSVEALEEGGSLGVGQTEEATQIDEIFNGFDEETRTSFQRWQASSATAIEGRGLDLNDALGNLAPFLTDATDVLEVLEGQETALRGVIRDTGTVFDAFSERGDALAGAIVGSRNTFAGLASEERALAEIFQILPTFQRESKLTLERLDRFQVNAQPLIRDLIPIARDLSPTLADVRRFAPSLRDLFIDLEELEHVSQKGLPALGDFLEGLRPVLDRLDPFLANLNPVVKYLRYNRKTVADFLGAPGSGFSGQVRRDFDSELENDPAPRHFLRQLSIVSPETLSLYPNRTPTNRGHGYIRDGVLNGLQSSMAGIFPNFDCKNTDYSRAGTGGQPDEQELRLGRPNPHSDVNSGNPADASFAACVIDGDFPQLFGGKRAPQVFRDP